MRNKWLMSLFIVILALPFFSGAVFAEETKQFEDGTHNIEYVVKHEDKDEVSLADPFFSKPASLIVENGKQFIQFKIDQSNMILSLKANGNEVVVVSEEENKRSVKFEVDGNLSDPVILEMHMSYGGQHTARAFFDVSNVPVKEDVIEEEPVESEPEEESTGPVEEEEKQVGLADLADGYYTVNASYLRDDNDNQSAMGRHLGDELFLSIKEGKAELTISINDDNTVTLLKLNGKNALEKKGDGKKRHETFKLDSLQYLYNAYVEYQAPMCNEKMHYGQSGFRIQLDETSITETVASNKPGFGIPDVDPLEPVEPEEPTKSEPPVENDGDKVENKNSALVPDQAYEINYVSESASVNRQFINPAVLLIKDGVKYIQINGTGGQFIESLSINGKEVTWGTKNADGTFTIQFKVEGSLSEVLDFGMIINARGTIMPHTVDLSFDESTQEAVDIKDYTLLPIDNDSQDDNKNEEPTKDEKANEKDNPVANDKEENGKPKTPKKKDQLTPDKAYKIGFVIKHETEDRPSSADSFFKGPAILLEKDGERYIQITVTGSEYINSLKTKHGDVVVVKDNGDGSIVVQFKVDGKISDVIELDMMITVPGVYENQKHKARLFLDESSMEEIEVGDYRLVASTNGNGPTVDGEAIKNTPLPGAKDNNTKTKHNPTIKKPELDSNEKNGSTTKTKVSGQEKNPQTGDTTNIMLYVLLLIGSAIPLAIQLKRRYANVA